MNILVLNAGSSSLKFQLIATDLDRIQHDRDERLMRGSIDRFGAEAEFSFELRGQQQETKENIPDLHAAIDRVLDHLGTEHRPDAVGHRVVHGGERFSESTLIDDTVLKGIEQCAVFAPLHNPSNLDGINRVRKRFGDGLPQVAVFDTAFHHTLPRHSFLYAVPYGLYEKHHIRRYGFHGTSHRYVAHRYRQIRGLTREQTNIITLHLGNGCSAAAIKNGRSVDTSMGMTPLEGLVMGTRSGDVDASLISLIAQVKHVSADDTESLLNHESGLLGISGISGDMRTLLSSDEQRAKLAIEIFCYRARKYIGSYLAAMGGANAIVFTGGIGEHAPAVRARICDGLGWAGLQLNDAENEKSAIQISTVGSTLAAFCIPTDEELLIARDTVRCILGVPHPS